MRKASVVAWAQKYAVMSEIRDRRELETIAQAMDHISRGDLQEVMDLLAQRVLSIRQAKAKGGDWSKSSAIELIAAEGTAPVPSGMRRLLA